MIVCSASCPGACCKVPAALDDKLLSDLVYIESKAHISPWDGDEIRMCFSQDRLPVVLCQDGIICGFACTSLILDEAELWTIGVLPKFQGRGLGRFLLHSTLALSKLCFARKCFLEVRRSNAVARSLYEKTGFVQMGVRKNYYAKTPVCGPEDAIVMACDLDALNFDSLTYDGVMQEVSAFLHALKHAQS